jgi:cell division protein FtsB
LIEKDQRSIQQLKSKDSLEHFARENYGHKKEDETIFYIEFEDSLDPQ